MPPAESVADAQSQSETGGAILVTGSRISNPGFVSPTPITAISSEQLEMTGAQTVQHIQQEIPVLIPNQSTQMVSSPPGGSTMNLRGLGGSRTLLLVDGRRVAPTSPEGTVDVNIIPVSLLERIEVVTGGASAAYGSDAVSGVVNLFLNTDYEGVKGSYTFGVTQYGDFQEHSASLTAGTSFADGRGHIVAAGGIFSNEGLLNQGDRPWGRHAWGQIANPFYVEGSNNGQPRILITPNVRHSRLTNGGLITAGPLKGIAFGPGGTLKNFEYGDYVGSQFMVGGDGAEYSSESNLAPVLSRQYGFAHATFDLTDNVELWAEGLYARARQFYDVTTNIDYGTLVMKRDNPYLPAALGVLMDANNLTSVNIGRSHEEQGWNEALSIYRVRRVAGGIKGTIGNSWNWEAYYQYSRNTYDYSIFNNRNNTLFALSIDAVADPVTGDPICRSTLTNPGNGCVPSNLFGPNAMSPAAVDYTTGTTRLIQTQTQHDVAFNVGGTLFENWAGDVAVALGAEYRKDSLVGTTDETSLLKQWRVLNPQPTEGSLNVKEGYVEVVFPLLSESPLAELLELNLAGRITDYNLSGRVETWKAGLNYQVTPDIRLRATRSRDIRAPNLNELFQSRGANVGSFRDPRDNTNISIFWSSGGNTALQPETADTFTGGVVLSPRFIPGLQLSVDYYKIKINDVITTLSGQGVLDGCYLRGQTDLCEYIHFKPNSTVIDSVDALRFNANRLETSGLDIELGYRLGLDQLFSGANGNLSFRALVNYIPHLITTASGVPTDSAGENIPHWRGNLITTYSNGPLRANVTIRWIDNSVRDNLYVEGIDINDNTVPGRTYVDISAEREIGDHFSVFGRIANLFNAYPPITPNGVTAPQTATNALFDTIGRRFQIGARFEF
ncbi:MAG TPA: TonB-dependent receptor [Croceibacterium sp.]|nr:TonB-dependent receptor [Croceibacterium sp.]